MTINEIRWSRCSGRDCLQFRNEVVNGSGMSTLMNDAVYKFKRYEDASLEYIGINKHSDESVGLFDTVLSQKDYQDSFLNDPDF